MTPNWKTYLIDEGSSDLGFREAGLFAIPPRGSERGQRHELHAGVFLIDLPERAVARPQRHPGVDELQEVVIPRPHGGGIERGRDRELVLDLLVGVAIGHGLRGEGRETGCVDLAREQRLDGSGDVVEKYDPGVRRRDLRDRGLLERRPRDADPLAGYAGGIGDTDARRGGD